MRTVKHSESAGRAHPVIDRRACLHGLIGTVLVIGMPAAAPAATAAAAAALERWLQSGGADTLGDRRTLGRLGEAYLTNAPDERDLRRLSQGLADDGSRPVAVQLIEHIARDWDAHHIVVADGWVLSRSEARLCAMVHLLDGAAA